MATSLILEKPGYWRWMLLIGLLGLMLLPTLWVLSVSVETASIVNAWNQPGFLPAVGRSLKLALWVMALALVIGCPYGVLCGLVKFPGRQLAMILLTVPLLVPAFPWAVGVNSLRPLVSYRMQSWFDGLPGCVFAACAFAIPLVVFAAKLATENLSRNQIDTARLAGGFRCLWLAVVRYALPVSLGAAMLGGILASADLGIGQIMGYHGIASEVLIAYSARYDSQEAAAKALLMMAVWCPFVLVVAWKIGGWFNAEFLGRDIQRMNAMRPRGLWAAISLALLLLPVLLVGPALLGLFRPLLNGPALDALRSGFSTLRESAPATLVYSLTGGLTAVLGGGLAAVCAGREVRWRQLAIAVGLLWISLPAGLPALGVALMATKCPPSLDWLTRGGWMVGVAMGMRLMPVALLVCLRAWTAMSRSWQEAAGLHGVPFTRYFLQVMLPILMPTLLVAGLLVALMASADVTTTLLLQPPGGATFATRIFAVMDNAAERLVAALCLVYLAGGLVAVTGVYLLGTWSRQPEGASR